MARLATILTAKDYLGALKDSLGSPNVVRDLRIPQNQKYIQVELDAVLADYLAGNLTTDQAAQTLYDKWEAITDEVGRDSQLASYKATTK